MRKGVKTIGFQAMKPRRLYSGPATEASGASWKWLETAVGSPQVPEGSSEASAGQGMAQHSASLDAAQLQSEWKRMERMLGGAAGPHDGAQGGSTMTDDGAARGDHQHPYPPAERLQQLYALLHAGEQVEDTPQERLGQMAFWLLGDPAAEYFPDPLSQHVPREQLQELLEYAEVRKLLVEHDERALSDAVASQTGPSAYYGSLSSAVPTVLEEAFTALRGVVEAPEFSAPAIQGRVDADFCGRAENVLHYFELDEAQLLRVPEGLPGEIPRRSFRLRYAHDLGGRRFTQYRQCSHDAVTAVQRLLEQPGSSLLVEGPAGAGSSTVLGHVVLWARRNGWLVVSLPRIDQLLGQGRIVASARFPGLYEQRALAKGMAEHLLKVHGDLLACLPLQRSGYASSLPDWTGATLHDLVTYATRQEAAAALAMAHFREELKLVTAVPVMIAVDGLNLVHGPTAYLDPATEGKAHLTGLQLMLPRLYGEVDHGLGRGVLVGSVSGQGLEQREYGQEALRSAERLSVPLFGRAEGALAVEHLHDYLRHVPLPVLNWLRSHVDRPALELAKADVLEGVGIHGIRSQSGAGELLHPNLVDYILKFCGGRPREILRLCALNCANVDNPMPKATRRRAKK